MNTKFVLKQTYPNGKIYICADIGTSGDLSYFGQPKKALFDKDFTEKEQQDLTVRKEVLWKSATASKEETLAKKFEFINKLKANDPAIGYNASTAVVPSVKDKVEQKTEKKSKLSLVKK